jgi:uncharacterized RDD family membrane protein YckC
VSTASVPPPGWVEPSAPSPASAPSARPAPTAAPAGDFAATLASEDRRNLDSRRVKARLVDAIICAPVYLFAMHQWGEALGAWALYQLAQLILAHFCEVTTGQTPGKRLMKLRVARKDDGGLPSPQQAAARGVIGIFEWGLIGLIALHVSKGRTRLGDRAAGTVMVDVTRHPRPSRGLTLGAFVYPVLWAIPVTLVCVAAAHGNLPGSYRQQADALCRRTDDTIRATLRSRGPYAVFDAYAHEHDALARLRAPAAWKARHAALVARTSAFATFSASVVQDVSRSGDPQGTWLAYDAELGRRIDADRAAARAAGYQDCGR